MTMPQSNDTARTAELVEELRRQGPRGKEGEGLWGPALRELCEIALANSDRWDPNEMLGRLVTELELAGGIDWHEAWNEVGACYALLLHRTLLAEGKLPTATDRQRQRR